VNPETLFRNPTSRLGIARRDDDVPPEREDVRRCPLLLRDRHDPEALGERERSHRLGRQEQPASQVTASTQEMKQIPRKRHSFDPEARGKQRSELVYRRPVGARGETNEEGLLRDEDVSPIEKSGRSEALHGQGWLETGEQCLFLPLPRLDGRRAYDRAPAGNEHSILNEYRVRMRVVGGEHGDLYPALSKRGHVAGMLIARQGQVHRRCRPLMRERARVALARRTDDRAAGDMRPCRERHFMKFRS
jgi:hypothetical protein